MLHRLIFGSILLAGVSLIIWAGNEAREDALNEQTYGDNAQLPVAFLNSLAGVLPASNVGAVRESLGRADTPVSFLLHDAENSRG